ncbi:TPA: DUF5347 domain-containing protein [Morganella morganii]|nr:DUF5347 family protein [Morganella morganii]MDU3447119.1 DUF5347 family protein [Morganella morganii]MDU3504117.1 DUF5347 family protein [Morganella morganii]HBL6943165.1 DUF5347 domain-containing protein [Morganella morganii]HCR3444486.1 DUF5347 domain-containing protein [Morganella morganii]
MNTATDLQVTDGIGRGKPEIHRAPTWNRAVSMTIDEKIDGMNIAAKMRANLFQIQGKPLNAGMGDFMKELRSHSNNKVRNNNRVLSMIFFLAEIEKEKHGLKFEQLTHNEQVRFIEAINQIKAVASIFPTDLAIK